jgi:ATP-dependent Clp protease ATP-binding subunit ClpC
MGTLNPNIPSPELIRALNAAAARMPMTGRPLLTPALLLLTFCRDAGSAANRLLTTLAAERSFRMDELAASAEALARAAPGLDADFTFTGENGKPIRLSTELVVVLDEGRSIAEATGEAQVGTEHALGGLAERGVGTAGILRRYGISRETLATRLAGQAQNKRVTGQDQVAQAKGGEGAPVYVREDLMRDLLGLLALANHRHVILVGDAGVGRRSLVQGLALLMAEGKGPAGLTNLVTVSEYALLSDAEKAVDTALSQARDGILFLPNVERFFGSATVNAEFPKATRVVQRALLGLRPVVIASTTDPAWNERLAADSTVRENTHRMRVQEPTVEETVAILGVHKSRLEHDYGVQIVDAALPAAANMGKRYVAGTPLPASALAVLHRAGALLKLAAQSSGSTSAAPQTGAPVSGDAAKRPDNILDADDVAVAVSVMTGIPVSKLGVDERARYAHMVDALHQRIIGQEEAVMAVSRAVKIARVGLKDPKRPIGSFLFLGPTGVGKTELAKALAEFMFGSEDAMVVLDMSEYQQDHTVNRLIGAPPGYVGYEGGGQLTEKVRQRPHTVVLFDEVEKAHPRVLDVLLQIMEEGRLTDAQGRTTSFSETVIIMTSNMGSIFLDKPVMTDEMRDAVMEVVRTTLRPEFLNRLDEIIMFLPLTPEQLRKILALQLKKEVKMLQEQGVTLEISEAAAEWMLAQNDHPEWGARPLRRIIQKNLREPLADWLLNVAPEKGAKVAVDAGNGGLVFSTNTGEAPAAPASNAPKPEQDSAAA